MLQSTVAARSLQYAICILYAAYFNFLVNVVIDIFTKKILPTFQNKRLLSRKSVADHSDDWSLWINYRRRPSERIHFGELLFKNSKRLTSILNHPSVLVFLGQHPSISWANKTCTKVLFSEKARHAYKINFIKGNDNNLIKAQSHWSLSINLRESHKK